MKGKTPCCLRRRRTVQGAGWAVKTEQRCTSGRRAAFWSWQPRLPTVVEQFSCQNEGRDEALSDSFPIGAREFGQTAGTKTCNFFTAYHIPGARLNADWIRPDLSGRRTCVETQQNRSRIGCSRKTSAKAVMRCCRYRVLAGCAITVPPWNNT